MPRTPTPTPTLTTTPTPLDLLGRWSLERDVEDRYASARLSVTGTALLEQVGDGRVRWHEEGVLTRPGSAPAAVHRTLLVVPDADGSWQVTFDDGRPFHPWSPGVRVDHLCADDLYRGLVDVPDQVRWTVTWQVRGPAKDHTITTAYTRPAG